MRIYIAGSLFSSFERGFLEEIDVLCKELGFETFLPHRDAGISDGSLGCSTKMFQRDVAGLQSSDMVIAVMAGSDIDSGTAWEIGYAHAKKMKVIGVIDDVRLESSMNAMLEHSILPVYSLEELRELLEKIKWEVTLPLKE